MIDRDDQEFAEDDPREAALDLGHTLQENFSGDDRFAVVELDERGEEEGEEFRLRLAVDDRSRFFIAARCEDGFIRVGLHTENPKAAEAAIEATGLSPTEFIAEAMDTDGDLDYEVVHVEGEGTAAWHAELPFESADELRAQAMHDEVIFYIEGFVDALLDHLG